MDRRSERTDVYPVEVRARSAATRGAAAAGANPISPQRRRYSVFDTSIGGIAVPGRRAAHLRGSARRERLDRVFGVAVNLEWARDHYFNDILQQVAQIAGNASATVVCRDRRSGPPRRGHARPGGAAGHRDARVPALVLRSRRSSPSIRRPIWRSARGPSPRVRPAIRRSCSPRAARGGASSSSARAWRCWRSACLRPPARRGRAPPWRRVRADFVATVTHELKTPLSTIRAVGETLVRGRVKTDHDLTRYAHLLVREERRLTRLVNNLLAYSRVTDVTEVYSFESAGSCRPHRRGHAGIPAAADATATCGSKSMCRRDVPARCAPIARRSCSRSTT